MSSIAIPLGIDTLSESTHAASDTGRMVREEIARIRCASAARASNWALSIGNDLEEIALECGEANWDGHGARPITANALKRAKTLASVLFILVPSGIPAPDVVPERDGDVALSWTRDRHRHLSVSISEDGVVNFAGILSRGVERHGSETFDGSDPSVLQDIARYVGRLHGR